MTTTNRPRLLDLFCGAGGAAMGYHRAGFDVVGVDRNPQPHYPFAFVQADAMTYPLGGFDVIHASPPCQVYCALKHQCKEKPDLYEAVRDRLEAAGVPWVIENVVNAPARWGIVLCGSQFGLNVRRHRRFELSHLEWSPYCNHSAQEWILTVTGNGVNAWDCRKGIPVGVAAFRKAMGIDWMTRKELSQAIPPAYTKWIGERILE